MAPVPASGARSGKSRHAQQLAEASDLPVTLIATAQARDAEIAARIARHRAEPPAGVIDGKVGFGTANLARESAMSDDQLTQCLEQGRLAVQRALSAGAEVLESC